MTSAPPRPSMSKARRLRLFARDEGRCWICGCKVKAGEEYDLDHVIAWAISYDDSDDNLKVAHKSCHRGEGSKTSTDVKVIAKCKRIEARLNGTRRERKPIPSRGFSTNGPKQKIPSRILE